MFTACQVLGFISDSWNENISLDWWNRCGSCEPIPFSFCLLNKELSWAVWVEANFKTEGKGTSLLYQNRRKRWDWEVNEMISAPVHPLMWDKIDLILCSCCHWDANRFSQMISHQSLDAYKTEQEQGSEGCTSLCIGTLQSYVACHILIQKWTWIISEVVVFNPSNKSCVIVAKCFSSLTSLAVIPGFDQNLTRLRSFISPRCYSFCCRTPAEI